MKAFDVGFQEGLKGLRNDRQRKYQSESVEKSYWKGYIAGVVQANPGKMIVQCEREGKIFAVEKDAIAIDCPTCGRRYMKEESGDFESDRKLTILA